MKLTLKDLAKKYAAEAGVSVSKAKDIISTVADMILEELQDGNEVALGNMFTLNVKEVAARTARNPITGEAVEVAAKNKITFKPSKAWKDAVN